MLEIVISSTRMFASWQSIDCVINTLNKMCRVNVFLLNIKEKIGAHIIKLITTIKKINANLHRLAVYLFQRENFANITKRFVLHNIIVFNVEYFIFIKALWVKSLLRNQSRYLLHRALVMHYRSAKIQIEIRITGIKCNRILSIFQRLSF